MRLGLAAQYDDLPDQCRQSLNVTRTARAARSDGWLVGRLCRLSSNDWLFGACFNYRWRGDILDDGLHDHFDGLFDGFSPAEDSGLRYFFRTDAREGVQWCNGVRQLSCNC